MKSINDKAELSSLSAQTKLIPAGSKKILCLGEKFDIISRINKMGYTPVLIDHSNVHNVPLFIKLDAISAKENTYNVEKLLKKLEQYKFEAIFACKEYYVILAEELATKIDASLINIGVEQARLVRNKLELKKFLFKENIPIARFSAITSSLNYSVISKDLGPRFLIKPKSEVMGLGIVIIDSNSKWSHWLHHHQNNINQYYAEEYLDDIKEYCCDCIVSKGKVIIQFTAEYTVSCLTANNTNCGYGVNFPGFSLDKEITDLKEIATNVIKKLSIENGFCHMEFFRYRGQWLFGEMGYRIPGGYQIPVESIMIDEHIFDIYLKIMLKTEKAPDKVIDTSNLFYGYYFYPKFAGTVSKITTDLKYDWVVESDVFVKEGGKIKKSDNYSVLAARVVYKAKSKKELFDLSKKVSCLIKIEYTGSRH